VHDVTERKSFYAGGRIERRLDTQRVIVSCRHICADQLS
jgi:hypothetical protein